MPCPSVGVYISQLRVSEFSSPGLVTTLVPFSSYTTTNALVLFVQLPYVSHVRTVTVCVVNATDGITTFPFASTAYSFPSKQNSTRFIAQLSVVVTVAVIS